MAIDAGDLETLKALEATVPETDTLWPLTSIPQVLAYLATWARAEGIAEDEVIELTARAADLGPAAARHAGAILGRLGYAKVADRLREIAGRRKHDLRPLA
ncbi:hypothetical protein [Bradyrhizobium sp. Ash2021]|uniref:hypothetical protein n=1 Tax=Bradyrhizobium sp. Ash2021 TaxID=2954771 RepID=UPI0028164074|nr:hypothetical protein [Bradyrhizobium sp. Ash2021]WMT78828.1 hypothetical protein NL528_21880 [Bradyrhizobium sp. Ash2021]